MAEVKLCECGCGEPAPIARKTQRSKGVVRGQPQRFILQHHSKPLAPLGERFAAKLIPAADLSPNGMAGCLLWTGRGDGSGYGRIKHRGKSVRTHRIAYLLAGIDIPADREPDHLCQRRSCVSLDHLELVTHAENSRRGPHVKLTHALVAEIRTLLAGGWLAGDIADAYGVARTTIRSIATGKAWA